MYVEGGVVPAGVCVGAREGAGDAGPTLRVRQHVRALKMFEYLCFVNE